MFEQVCRCLNLSIKIFKCIIFILCDWNLSIFPIPASWHVHNPFLLILCYFILSCFLFLALVSGYRPELSLLISGPLEEVVGGEDAKQCAVHSQSGCMSGLFPATAWPQDAARRKKAEDPDSYLHLARALVLSDSGNEGPAGFLNNTASENNKLVMNPGAAFELGQ